VKETDKRANPALSDQRIDEAPDAIKALFKEYDINDVIAALSAVGLNGPPKMFSKRQIEIGAATARKILAAEMRAREEARMRHG